MVRTVRALSCRIRASSRLVLAMLPIAAGCQPAADDSGTDDTGADDTGADLPDIAPDRELLVNEFMASNHAAWEDPGVPGTFPDWIELYNLTASDVHLDGYRVTDDVAEPEKAALYGGLVLPANGWLLLVADGDVGEGPQHLPFKLSASGEDLAIYRPNGDALDAIRFTAQTADVSWARTADGGETWGADPTSTPGTANAGR